MHGATDLELLKGRKIGDSSAGDSGGVEIGQTVGVVPEPVGRGDRCELQGDDPIPALDPELDHIGRGELRRPDKPVVIPEITEFNGLGLGHAPRAAGGRGEGGMLGGWGVRREELRSLAVIPG